MSFLRRALVSMEAAVLTSKQSLGMKLNIPVEKDIFLFNNQEMLRQWVVSSDRSIGGLSECRLELQEPANETAISGAVAEGLSASAVFSGRLSMACQPTEAGIIRSGYCAVRGTLPRNLLLHGYEGITMRVKTDGREYRLNAQVDGWNPLNLYMGFIRTPPNEWVDIELPFRDFLLTAKGYYKLNDPTPLDPGHLKNFGIAIADQKEGDFRFEIQWIKAVAKIESREIDDEEIRDGSDNDNSRNGNFRKSDDLAI